MNKSAVDLFFDFECLFQIASSSMENHNEENSPDKNEDVINGRCAANVRMNKSTILPNLSFEESENENRNSNTPAEVNELARFDPLPIHKERKKHTWITEETYEDLQEAIDHINGEGFVLHNSHDLKCGQKFHFRCKKVPSDKKPWCNRQYLLYLPSDRAECIVQHNNMEHNCTELMKNAKKRISPEMQDFIFGLFEKGTVKVDSVMNHVKEEISKNEDFSAECLPKQRQIEYLLTKFRNSKVQPLFQLGDLMEWCSDHSSFPENDNEAFVLASECSPLHSALKFRFVLSTPEMLRRARNLETICIDATYKLNWHGFPLIVLGTVDRTKKFHPIAYACSTHETAEDYEFVFATFHDAIEILYEKKFEPKTLIADGADAIRNAFYKTFDSAVLDIMCFAHVIRNVRKRTFSTKSNKQLILDDIRKIQLASNENTFLLMTKLFCEKWMSIEPEFVEYFKKEWLGVHCNWYEGAAVYTPSTNNALESHNAVIKRTITMRKRLPLNQFLTSITDLMMDISKQYASGTREIINKPSVHKNLMRQAALFEQQKFKAFKAIRTTIPTYIIPSSNCPAELGNVAYYSTLVQKSWTTFDEFINHGFQFFWIVQLSSDAWDSESSCTCPSFFKNNMCKHIIALAMREKILTYADNLNPTVISAVRRRPGRVKNSSKALSKD